MIQEVYPRMRIGRGKNWRAIHIVVAEKALGRPFSGDIQVHHIDENKKNSRNDNLVICPDSAYHKLLHRRTEALNVCGNANWVKCCFCKKHDAPENVKSRNRVINGSNWAMFYHPVCRTAKRTQQRLAKGLSRDGRRRLP